MRQLNGTNWRLMSTPGKISSLIFVMHRKHFVEPEHYNPRNHQSCRNLNYHAARYTNGVRRQRLNYNYTLQKHKMKRISYFGDLGYENYKIISQTPLWISTMQ